MESSDFLKIKRNLTALVEFSRNINAQLDLRYTLNNLLLSCFGKFHTTRGFVALFENGKLIVCEAKGLPAVFKEEFPEIKDAELGEKLLREHCTKYKINLIECIDSSKICIGVVGLGDKMNKSAYADDEIEFFKTVINIAATAVQNSRMITELQALNKNLDGRINRLGSLFELSKEFSLIQDEDRIAKTLLYSLLGHFLTSQYAIVYHNNNQLKILNSTFAKPTLQKILSQYNISNFKQPLLKSDIQIAIPEFCDFPFELLIPMRHQETTRGLLLLGKKGNKEEYHIEDIDFISSLGGIALISLENKRLFSEALEKQKMEEELEIAKDIQRNLLPHTIPLLGNFEAFATSISSKQIGGDYYDLIRLDETRYAVAIGDVSGKGVPAALLMANVQAFLKSICKRNLPISEATGLLNDLVTENTSDGRFITFFWCYLDIDNNKITYVNAGHNPPLLIRNGEIKYLDQGGMIYGVMKTMAPYIAEEIEMQRGDVLVMFTDGVTEAKNSADDEYSDERLESLVKQSVKKPAKQIVEEILDDVHRYVNGFAQSDDITIVVLKYE